MTQIATPPEPLPAKDGGFNLPVLPVDWEYEVRITGPENQKLIVSRFGGLNGRHGVYVQVETGVKDANLKTLKEDSLADGVRTAAGLVRTLRDLSEHERKSQATRDALFAQIGQPAPQNDDEQGSVTGDGEGLDQVAASVTKAAANTSGDSRA